MGEDPKGIPNNLLPYISQVAAGRLEYLSIFGSNYVTPDGTGVRDFIHVVDLAIGHLKALEVLNRRTGANVWNLGTGKGFSVLEMVSAFERVTGRSIPYRFAPRRAGDIAACWADPSKALRELEWRAERTLDDMVRDSWRWQQSNPAGYDK
jgi:UDP-glucose 4-epimerase